MKIWMGEREKRREEGRRRRGGGERKGDGMQEICEKDVGRSVDLIWEIRAESRSR